MVIKPHGRDGIMPASNLDFLQALAALLRWGVAADRAILALEDARRQGKYTLVDHFHFYGISYGKQGWTISVD